MRVLFSQTASRDFVEVIDNMTLLNRSASSRLADRFDSLFRQMGRFPESGAVCYHVSSFSVRFPSKAMWSITTSKSTTSELIAFFTARAIPVRYWKKLEFAGTA